jgi:hypothetical protein
MKFFDSNAYQSLAQSIKTSELLNNKPAAPVAPAAQSVPAESTPRRRTP